MRSLCRAASVSLLTLLVVVGLVAPALGEPVPPRPGHEAFVTTDAKVPVLDGPDGKHQATIDTRLYVPRNATAKTPQPAIVMTHGFGLTKLSDEVVAYASFFARHGYVVLTYTAQGFGASSGCVTLQSRTYDVKDAQQLISTLLDTRQDVQKDANGAVVGMVGGSYGGGIQANLAENDARIHAIAPGRTWNSLQYSLNPNNRVVPGDPTGFTHELSDQGVFKQQWTALFLTSGNLNPLGGTPSGSDPKAPAPQGDCPGEKLRSGDPTQAIGIPCVGFYAAPCLAAAQLTATGDARPEDRALLRDSSAVTQIERLRVPTLLVQGQRDTLFNINDAVATYTALRDRGVPVKMIWNFGGHGGYDSLPGECEVYGGKSGRPGPDFTALDDCYLSLRTLAFMDDALRGIPDRSPGFTFHRDWVPYGGKGANDEQYGAAAAFPLAGSTTYTLSGSSALVTSGAQAGSASFTNPPLGVPPAYTETANFTGPQSAPRIDLPPREQPGQNVSFTSEPFATDVVSVGIPRATLRLSHLAPADLVFFGKVYDVAPDGTATLLRRLVSAVRVPASAVGQPVTFNLLGFAHRFEKGHAVRLTLSATDASYRNATLPDQITVTTGAGSTFTLPTQLAQAAAPPAPVAAPRPPSAPLPATGPAALPGLVGMGLLAVAWAVRRRLLAR